MTKKRPAVRAATARPAAGALVGDATAPGPGPGQGDDWCGRHPWAVACISYLAFLLLTLAAYRGLWATLYYKDDYHWLSIANEMAKSPWRLMVLDPDNGAAGVRAVQRSVFGVIHTFFGINASAYHVASMLLHALNATLVLFLLRRLLRDVDAIGPGRKLLSAVFGAFVFATTSLHAAAVMWMAAMSTLLVTAALMLLFRYVLAFETRLHRRGVQLGALGIFVFALACKNTAVAFPLVLALYLLVCSAERHVGAGRARFVVLLAVVGVVQVLVTKSYIGRLDWAGAFGEGGAYAVSTNVPLNVLGAFMGNLMPASTYEKLLPGIPFPYLAVPLLLALLALFRSLPYARPALLGLGWLLAMAVPVALFDYVQYSGEQIMVSRYYYMPLVGGCVLLVFLILATLQYRGATRFLGVVVALGALLHGALHLPALRAEIAQHEAYGSSRMLLYESTLDAVQKRSGSGAIVYALGWPVPESALPHIGRHFFAPHGITLLGGHDFESQAGESSHDAVQRFVARWDAAASMLTVRRLTPARGPE